MFLPRGSKFTKVPIASGPSAPAQRNVTAKSIVEGRKVEIAVGEDQEDGSQVLLRAEEAMIVLRDSSSSDGPEMGGTRRGRCQTVVSGVVPEAKHAQQEHQGGRERHDGSTWDSRRGLSRREARTQEGQGGERHAQGPPTRRCGARSPDERTTWSVPKAKADKRVTKRTMECESIRRGRRRSTRVPAGIRLGLSLRSLHGHDSDRSLGTCREARLGSTATCQNAAGNARVPRVPRLHLGRTRVDAPVLARQ